MSAAPYAASEGLDVEEVLSDAVERANIESGLQAGAKQPRTPPARQTARAAPELSIDLVRAPEPEPQALDLVTLGSLLTPALDRAERRRNGDEKPIPIPWPSYAEALGGGLWPGAHYVVSGTGVGKSQMSMQIALGAAKAGVPTVYIGLELEEMQIAMRALGDETDTRWSGLYLGRCSPQELERARAAVTGLEGLPFYCEFSPARGWAASRLATLCASVRRGHPSGPLLVVLDYLQLVGDEPGEFERRGDTRDRISRAAITARDVARRFDAAIVVISSAARAHYGLLASDCKEAGLVSSHVSGHFAPVRTILKPSLLLGLGKESGETEYSADSVTVLIRWPSALASGETAIVCATPKVRSMGERWCCLAFDGGRFRELPAQTTAELPEVAKRGGKGKPIDRDERDQRVLKTAREAAKPYSSPTKLAEASGGNKQEMLRAVKALVEAGSLVKTDHGIVVGPAVPDTGEQNQ